ncbi:MAG: Dabb family protein [Planktothrix sp.]|uniref:Dabb family protein n=1 Tax=Planktothrix sp. TaxID=3088171 RepID=UPI0038D38477
MIQHIVLFKFKEGISSEKIDEAFTDLEKLKELIPGILSYSSGINSSPENINRGYTHGFIMTFATAQDRDVYLPHPEHEKVKEKLSPILADDEGALVFDFEC